MCPQKVKVQVSVQITVLLHAATKNVTSAELQQTAKK